MITELTGLEVSNASLLDEASAASEAMVLSWNSFGQKRSKFLVSKNVFPTTISVVQSRAKFLGIDVEIVEDFEKYDFSKAANVCGILV